MTSGQKKVANSVANVSLLSSAGLAALSQFDGLSVDGGDLGEPVALILGLLGAALKVWKYFSSKKD